MANDAIYVNAYSRATQDITVRGSSFLWAVFAIMLVTDLVVIGWHFMVPRGHRLFHQMAAIVLTTASIAYFSMASGLGGTPVQIEFSHANNFPLGTTRSIYYVRYIDWVVTTPALLLTLLMSSALPLSDIITIVFFDIVMIITGLVGALVPSSYKWGYFAFGCAAEVYVTWALLGPALTSTSMLGGGFKKAFMISASALSFLWVLYPIAWGLADGGNVITSDGEMIFYGILDVLAKPVWTMMHLYLLSREDLTVLQLSSGKYTSTSGVTALDSEKLAATAGTGNTAMPVGATTGHTNQKKSVFGRRGNYDATAPTAATETNEIAPRTSHSTAVSHST